MLETVSTDYEGSVTFLAIAGLSELDRAAQRSNEWFPSGRILWGLDEDQTIWRTLGVSGTPTTVLIDAQNRVVSAWAGEVGDAAMRSELDSLAGR